MSRHWDIVDLTFPNREIEGEGVIGKQPIIEPGQMHQYVSGCNLKSGLGKMSGYYTMERLVDGKQFSVKIPQFDMVVPFKLN
jgi:ApaG protein